MVLNISPNIYGQMYVNNSGLSVSANAKFKKNKATEAAITTGTNFTKYAFI